jgi:SAM-dependent methyltransferase
MDKEVGIVNHLVTRSIREFLKTMNLVSETYLSQVLVALWDSGFYEYVRDNEQVEIKVAAEDLDLDPIILQSLIEYLVGRGLMEPEGDGFVLSNKGKPYWNYLTRGLLISHVAGYNALLTRLGPLLRKEINLYDPSLDRSARHVAVGAGYTLLGSCTAPWVLSVINKFGGKCVMDFGCGAGDFLIQLALNWPYGKGVGIDMSAEAINEAKGKAYDYGVSERVEFHQAKLSAEPLNIQKEVLDSVDTLTAMFVLHEFGGSGGAESISQILSALHMHFPGRKLVIAEATPADPYELCTSPPPSYSQLDYSFFHPLSRQGPLRTPEEWKQIINKAGAKLIERIPGFKLVPSWISLYVVEMN